MFREMPISPATTLALLLSLGICGCLDSITDPLDIEGSTIQTPSIPDSVLETRILVDASHDGGVWWFPQSGPFSSEGDHQGRALAEYLRGWGYEVEELPRGTLITDSLLAGYKYVFRASEWGTYRPSELEAYSRFVERETTLILLSDHRQTDPNDELAESLGVMFTGFQEGFVSRFAAHAITEGVAAAFWYTGAVATAVDPGAVEILVWVNDTIPAMGLIHAQNAKVFFSGDTNIFQTVPQPLVDNLIRWGFGRQ